MRRKLWVVLGISIIVLLILFFVFSINNKPEVKPKETESTRGSWHYVSSFSGPLDDAYIPFNIKGDTFRITSSGKSYQGDYNLLTLYVFAPGTKPTLYFTPQNTSTQTTVNFDETRTVSLMGRTFNLTEAEYQAASPYPSGGHSTPQVEEILRLKVAAFKRNLFEEQLSYGLAVQDWVFKNMPNFRKPYSEFFVLSPTIETSTSYADSGEYYLVVGSYNIQSWNIQI